MMPWKSVLGRSFTTTGWVRSGTMASGEKWYSAKVPGYRLRPYSYSSSSSGSVISLTYLISSMAAQYAPSEQW